MYKYEEDIQKAFNSVMKTYGKILELTDKDILYLMRCSLTSNPYAIKKFRQDYEVWNLKLIHKTQKVDTIKYANPSAISTNPNPGVYLLLQANLNYDTQEMIYTCKIGTSNCIKSRIRDYHTHNVGFYHNDMSITIPNLAKRTEFEKRCHFGLAKLGYNKVCGESAEWFLIDEEMFYKLKSDGIEMMKKLASL